MAGGGGSGYISPSRITNGEFSNENPNLVQPLTQAANGTFKIARVSLLEELKASRQVVSTHQL